MNGRIMADSNRPKYISFDIYGTLINWDTDSTTRRLLAGRLPEEQWPAFKKVFRGYRFDEVLGDYKPYEQILQNSFDRVCKYFGIGPTPGAGAEFADTVRSFGAHDDVPAPLKLMGDNYKLVALSNASSMRPRRTSCMSPRTHCTTTSRCTTWVSGTL
jgi:2-haloacid dehalogenase